MNEIPASTLKIQRLRQTARLPAHTPRPSPEPRARVLIRRRSTAG